MHHSFLFCAFHFHFIYRAVLHSTRFIFVQNFQTAYSCFPAYYIFLCFLFILLIFFVFLSMLSISFVQIFAFLYAYIERLSLCFLFTFYYICLFDCFYLMSNGKMCMLESLKLWLPKARHAVSKSKTMRLKWEYISLQVPSFKLFLVDKKKIIIILHSHKKQDLCVYVGGGEGQSKNIAKKHWIFLVYVVGNLTSHIMQGLPVKERQSVWDRRDILSCNLHHVICCSV